MQSRLAYFVHIGLGILICQTNLAFAEHVVVESPKGQVYVLHVHPEDSFLDVVGAMPAYFEDEPSTGDRIDDEVASFKVCMLTKQAAVEQRSKQLRAEPRNYALAPTPSQASDIGYIVKTLANSSLPKIKSAESSLKKAGDRIDAVHPLQFLICIFSNEELKVCLRNLQGRTWVWKDFLNGITETLQEEDRRGNIQPYIQDYAAKIGVASSELQSIAQSGRWDRFVGRSIDLVPRAPGSNRYNM